MVGVLLLTLVAGVLSVLPEGAERHYSKCGGCNPFLKSMDVFYGCRFLHGVKCCGDFKKQGNWCWRKSCGGCGDKIPPTDEDKPCAQITKPREEYKKILLCCDTHILHPDTKKCKRKSVERKCGIAGLKPSILTQRILNGNSTYHGQFPWQAAIFLTGSTIVRCGGTLISERLVLTAAHCQWNQTLSDFTLMDPTQFVLKIGDHNRRKIETLERTHYIKTIMQYPDFNPKSNRVHDLAIWILTEPVKLSSFRWAACLPENGKNRNDYDNSAVEVSGWGWKNAETKKAPYYLQHGNLTVIPWKECHPNYTRRAEETKPGFCVLDTNQGTTRVCKGDSGGGLMLYNTTTRSYTVIGVNSFGKSGCPAGTPSIFASLTGEALKWVKKIKQDNEDL